MFLETEICQKWRGSFSFCCCGLQKYSSYGVRLGSEMDTYNISVLLFFQTFWPEKYRRRIEMVSLNKVCRMEEMCSPSCFYTDSSFIYLGRIYKHQALIFLLLFFSFWFPNEAMLHTQQVRSEWDQVVKGCGILKASVLCVSIWRGLHLGQILHWAFAGTCFNSYLIQK